MSDTAARTKTWTVELVLDEVGDRTRAEARLRAPAGGAVTGTGTARRNPADPDVPEIGDELAAARALSDLAHALLETASQHIESVTHQPATIRA